MLDLKDLCGSQKNQIQNINIVMTSNWFQSAKEECLKTRNNLGFFDLTPFVKFDLYENSHDQLQYLR